MIDPNRPYRRIEIDLASAKRKAAIKRGGDGLALYQDCYTGKTLRGGDPYDYEHIRSSESIFNQFKSQLTDLQIAEVVNCPDNVGVTLRKINQSKGKYRMEDWIRSSLNKPEYEVNASLVLNSLKGTEKGILSTLNSMIKLKKKQITII